MSAPAHTARRLTIGVMSVFAASLFFLAALRALWAFQKAQPNQASDQAELTSHDTDTTFKLKSQRNLVVVPVVVRDAKGKAVGNLRLEDFRLFDNGKPQVISHFTVEGTTAGAGNGLPRGGAPAGAGEVEAGATAEAKSVPRRFVALFFDDVHVHIADMMRVQMAAAKYLASSVRPDDRIGVYTASGRVGLDFTSDPEKVRATIARILPRPIIEPRENACPDVVDYQAYKIVEQHDEFAIQIAYQEYYHCYCEQYEATNPSALQACEARGPSEVDNAAMEMMNIYETNSRAVLESLKQTIRSLATHPGQRAVVLVSPGFLARGFEMELDGITDRAIRSNVTVNALDAKGLYAPLAGSDDMSKVPIIVPRRPDVMGQKEQIRIDRVQEIAEPLSQLAASTGGVFFQNNNDLQEGFRRTAALPEVYYVLTFSPANLKANGRLHALRVSLVGPRGLSVASRRGYFAPSSATDPAVKAREDIKEAVFSQDVVNELPVEVHTQFFRSEGRGAKLSVLTHVGIGRLRFRKQQGRNLDNLTMVTALFDDNGQIVKSQEKTLEMRLRDGTLARFSQSGVTIKTVFDVKPGTYLVREVVRDTEGEQLSGLNRTVEIPN